MALVKEMTWVAAHQSAVAHLIFMHSNRHQHYLEKMALRAAQSAIERNGRENFNREDVGRLRFQTVELWKRLLFGGAGVLFAGLAGFLVSRDCHWTAACALCLVAGAFLLVGIFGRKRRVDDFSNTSADILSSVVEAVLIEHDG